MENENDIGYLMWMLESYEDFFQCYKTMIEQE
jgi:hypothetical protein